MKKYFLMMLTVIIARTTVAADLRIMTYDAERNVYSPVVQEKIQHISASNVDGSTIVTAIGKSIICQVITNSFVEATSILSVIQDKSVLECYTREIFSDLDGRRLVRTRQINISIFSQ